MKTFQPSIKEVKRNWHLIDAKEAVLGRISTDIAKLLMGKHKSDYVAHLDLGDNVVVLNAEKVKLTGKKADQKIYRRHSGYPGGLKEVSFTKMIEEKPEDVIRLAVSGMLPDNRLKKVRLTRLKIIKGPNNPYEENFK